MAPKPQKKSLRQNTKILSPNNKSVTTVNGTIPDNWESRHPAAITGPRTTGVSTLSPSALVNVPGSPAGTSENMDTRSTSTQKRKKASSIEDSDDSSAGSASKKVATDGIVTAISAATAACYLARVASEEFEDSGFGSVLASILVAMEKVLEALKSTSSSRDAATPRPTTVDASTSTDKPVRQRPRKTATGAVPATDGKLDNRSTNFPPLAVPASQPTTANQEGWTKVVKRGRLPSGPPATNRADAPAPRPSRPKPAAVLVKVPQGSTYADTVRVLRTAAGLNPADFGAKVTSMRQTRGGHLIVELGKGVKSELAAGRLGAAITEKIGDRVGGVAHLGQYTDLEVIDIDAIADKDEVLTAIRLAIPGDANDPAAIAERDAVSLTGLWAVRGGQQVATLRVAKSTAAKIARVTIGWTVCRVRERRPPPIRCFRCHGFGHRTDDCKGPDLSAACRRCGETGHIESECRGGDDLCVACDRAGHPRIAHRPGSGPCAARKAAKKVTKTAKR